MLASKNLAARGLRGQAAAGLRRMSAEKRTMSSSANRDTTVYGQGTSTTFTVEKKSHLTMRDIGEKIPIPTVNKFSPPPRLLCGPGPGNAHPRVHAAMSLPQVGHLDPYFLELMEDIKALLRYTYQTKNEFTVPVSGTGSAAMEACVANMVEPGDKILVGVNGYFGHRMINMAKRYGGEPIAINKPWGQVFTYEEIKAAIEKSGRRL
jgi:DNA-binding transcriptional MocR family regulator